MALRLAPRAVLRIRDLVYFLPLDPGGEKNQDPG
jgi:hypothetical protein